MWIDVCANADKLRGARENERPLLRNAVQERTNALHFMWVRDCAALQCKCGIPFAACIHPEPPLTIPLSHCRRQGDSAWKIERLRSFLPPWVGVWLYIRCVQPSDWAIWMASILLHWKIYRLFMVLAGSPFQMVIYSMLLFSTQAVSSIHCVGIDWKTC